MNPTETTRRGRPPVAHAILNAKNGMTSTQVAAPEVETATPQAVPRQIGYGLPCAKCRTYYSADLPACPVCHSPERVSPVPVISPSAEADPELSVDPAAVEEERERFLQEFNSQLSQQLQIHASSSYRCSKSENHPGGFEAASVCQGCYDHLQERVDLLEAALHIDVKEAAQLVYEAVWADPSDPTKTYQNAAQALLHELHKRAGISAVLGPHQPRLH